MKFKILLASLLFSVVLSAKAQRIIGYYPNYKYTSPANNHLSIQWGKMTHLYYFSLNPTRTATGQSDGSLWIGDPYSWFTTTYFNNVVAQARAVNPNIKILIVSGGAPGSDSDLNDRFNYIASNASRLNRWCNNICNFIKTNNLDGWDLDWEFPNTSAARANHEAMLAKMRQKIDSMKLADCKHYEITIAVGGGYTDRNPKTCWNPAHTDYVNANVINYVDLVNIMTYDGNIGSPPCSFSSHQHYDLVVKALGDWVFNFPTWPKSKMTIGVGFYNNSFTAFSSGGNNSTYYNQTYWPTGGSGCPNMQAKIDYARTQGLAGTFIWELTQDNLCSGTVPACYSLLDCMYQRTISTWGTWTAPGNPCSMPVVLTNFSGTRTGNNTYLSWSTSEEKDHDHFIVQRSHDGLNFEDAGKVKYGQEGEKGFNYTYLDHTPSGYYRLKIVSVNGREDFSKIIKIGDDVRADGISVFPNPFENSLTLILPKDVQEVKIINVAGQEILSVASPPEGEMVLGENWLKGVYFIRIISSSGISVEKIVKR